jgi:hypothetical protein
MIVVAKPTKSNFLHIQLLAYSRPVLMQLVEENDNLNYVVC